MTLTKATLIESIRQRAGLSPAEASHALETLLEIIKGKLEEGEDVLISRFGKFCVRDKSSRRGRNPHTGDPMILGARRVVVFKCSERLKDKINGAAKAQSKQRKPNSGHARVNSSWKAARMWKDRADLPDFKAIRGEWDRK